MKIVFFDPSLAKIGGAEVLLLRFIIALGRRAGEVDIIVVDHENSFLFKSLDQTEIIYQKVIYRKERKIHLREKLTHKDCLVSYQRGVFLLDIFSEVGSPFLLIWEMHKAFWSQPKWAIFPEFLWRRSIQSIIDGNSMLILEEDSRKVAEANAFLNTSLMRIVPIFVDRICFRGNFKPNFESLRYASVGRASFEKIHPIVWFAKKIRAGDVPSGKLTFITDKKDEAEKIISSIDCDVISIINIMDSLSGEKLDKYLNDNVDVYIGMGTSVLEAAKLGIPTIIVDGSSGLYPMNAKVRRLSRCFNNLGTTTPSMEVGEDLNYAIESIVGNYMLSAKTDHEYVIKFHSENEAVRVFESCIRSGNMLRMDAFLKMPSVRIMMLQGKSRRLTRKIINLVRGWFY